LILSYQASHQPEKATHTMKQMMVFARENINSEHMHLARSIQARLWLLQGKLEAAVQWQETTNFSSDTGIMFFWLDVPRITQCRVLVKEGSKAGLCKAKEKLKEYLAFNQATRNTPQMIEILLLLALVSHKQGQNNEAVTLLERAVTLAVPGNYICTFITYFTDMADLLKNISMQDAGEEFIKRVLSACDPQINDNSSKSKQEPGEMILSLDNPLSRRETEVLLQVSQGLSNKEVAARLYISPETVKKHTINLYDKLDVHNRQQAVLKAYELNLFKPGS